MKIGSIVYSPLHYFVLFFWISVSTLYGADFTVAPLLNSPEIAVYEVTGNYDAELPDGSLNVSARQQIIKNFYASHPDKFDFLIIFSNFDFQMPRNEAIAFYQEIRNDVQGIGKQLFDNSSLYGSNGILQGTVDMGNIRSLISDPLESGFSETMGTLSHELLHRWAANVTYVKPDDSIGSDLLGKDGNHWSFLLDTAGSLEYGNSWVDNGNGTFTSRTGRRYFSPLDMYLMGLVDKSEVDPMLLIENADIDPQRLPEPGINIEGSPQFVAIDDIIAAEGERIPGVTNSQKTFRIGSIFITRPDTFSEANLQGIRNIMKEWPIWFSGLTNGLAKIVVDNSPMPGIPQNPGPIITPVDPRLTPPAIKDGVVWLVNSQLEDGSWQDSSLTVSRDTATVLSVLAGFAVAEDAWTKGVDWLQTRNPANQDYLARKIELLSKSGLDAAVQAEEFLAKQNSDGGWGGNDKYESNVVDTALALQALTSAGFAAPPELEPALGYLLAEQNPDYGWGSGGQSGILPTLNVLLSLLPYRDQHQLALPLDNALAWIASRQNTDGGFGDSSSTIYSTAKAIITLKQYGVFPRQTESALDYILSQQAQDGSWLGSAYQTSLAVQAVWTGMQQPDLSVRTEEIIPSPPVVTTLPTEIRLAVTIHNSGLAEVADAQVFLYEGGVGESSKIGEALISIGGQASQTLDFNYVVEEGRGHHFYVVVDPDNLIKESSEQNNSALRIVYPESTYDFAVQPEDLAINPGTGSIYEPLAISAAITNAGTVDTSQVPVQLVADTASGALIVAEKSVDLPAGKSTSIVIPWVPKISGTGLRLSLVVDPHNAFAELNEENNAAAIGIDIKGSVKADLSLSHTDITVDPSPALENGTATLKAVVHNRGFSTATDVRVDLYEGEAGINGMFLGSVILPAIGPGERADAVLDWEKISVSGQRVISALVDPLNTTDEIIEENNAAFTTLRVLALPDFVVDDSSISFSPQEPLEGDEVTVTAIIYNQGEQTAIDVPVAFYADNQLLGTAIIPEIKDHSQAPASISFSTDDKAGIVRINVIVDPKSAIPEQDTSNNSAVGEVGVQNSDLWLSQSYISPNGDGVKDITEFGYRLPVQQTVSIVVVNEQNAFVREFSGPDYTNISFASLVWDGLDNMGRVVDDGQYWIQVLTKTGSVIASLPVTVDTNRSPLIKAIGTPYLFQSEIHELLTYERWIWFPDDSGILFYLEVPNENLPEYPSGLYTMSPTGGSISRIVPWEWNSEFSEEEGYRFRINSSDCRNYQWWNEHITREKINPGFSLTDDGSSIAFILEKYRKTSEQLEQSQLWTVNRFGENLTLLASYDHAQGEQRTITDVFWSPDGSHLAFKSFEQVSGRYQINILRSDGEEEKVIIPDWTTDTGHYYQLFWSPDSKHFVYVERDQLVMADLSGQIVPVMTVGEQGTFINWFDNNRILIRDIRSDDNWYQDVWIADVRPEIEVVFIGEKFKRITNTYGNGKQCVRSPEGKSVYNSQINTSGHFIADFVYDNYPYYNYKICNADGECQDAEILEYWWGEYSLSPDSKYLVHHFYDGLLEVYDLNKRQTEISILGYSACDIDWEVDYPDLPSSFKIIPQEGECQYYHFMEAIRWNWLDSSTFLAWFAEKSRSIQKEGIFAFNFKTREKKHLPENWELDELILSPNGKYITYVTEDINRKNKYYDTVHVNGSLLNLTASLNPSKSDSALNLSGTASDLNFSSWKLEYADHNAPNDWRVITHPNENQIVNGFLAAWVPPYEGSFLVRLTVADKAGNVAWDREVVTWGKKFSVTNIYKTGELFSPDGDGVKDTVSLGYFVHEPVHLELSVHDKSGKRIRTFYQDHALPGEYSLVWDGRDEAGGIVADGYYSIRIFDYEFFFAVDTTPPQADAAFTPVSCDGGGVLRSSLQGLALDANFRSWSIESGSGEIPEEWYPFASDDGPLFYSGDGTEPVLDDTGNPTMVLVQKFTPATSPSFGSLANTSYRLVAEDYAGNRSVVGTRFGEELLVLRSWDGEGISLEKDEAGLCSSPDYAPIGLLVAGPHKLSVTETLRKPIVSATVQYRMHMHWHDAATLVHPPDGEIDLIFDTATLDPQDIHAVRVQFVDEDGLTYYTNSLVFHPPVFTANMGCIAIGSLAPALITMDVSLPENLQVLKLQAGATGSEDIEWGDIEVYEIFDGFPYQFAAPLPEDLPPGYGYPLRLIGIGESGKIYESNELTRPPRQCGSSGGGSDVPDTPGALCKQTTLAVSYQSEKALCNAAGESLGKITLDYCPNDQPTVLPNAVRYYLQADGETRLIKHFDLPADGWGSVILATRDLSEGKHRVWVDLIYDDSVVERFRENTLVVDRTLPTAKITYPALTAPFCARRVEDDQGNVLRYTDVEGVADDVSGIQGYSVVYGEGHTQDQWYTINDRLPCSPELGDCRNTSNAMTLGRLGAWNVTGFANGEYALQLMVTDAYGNTSCVSTPVMVDMQEEFMTATLDAPIFSPNNDGVADQVSLAYQAYEYVVLDVSVLKDETVVRSLATGSEVPRGTGTIFWDGLDDEGATVPDGLYQLHVQGSNACGNLFAEKLPITVDTLPPTTMIAYPGTGEPLPVNVEVVGTAWDEHLDFYRLEARDETDSENPIQLKEDSIGVENAFLGSWNTFGLAGDWALTLHAEDLAGNTRTTRLPVSFGSRAELIKGLAAEPVFFSPNGDGRFEHTTVTYELADTANVILTLADMSGNSLATERRLNITAGRHMYQWAGLDADSRTVADGNYTLIVSAESIAAPYTTQSEGITLVVDTTQPVIDMASPGESSYLPGSVQVQGALRDINLKEYSVALSCDQETIFLGTSAASGGRVFSRILDLDEGTCILRVEAGDAAQNSAVLSRSFTVDTTRPRITLSSPVKDEMFGGPASEIAVKGVIEDENLRSYLVQYGQGIQPTHWVELSSGEVPPSGDHLAAWSVGPESGLTDGDYTIRVQAVDRAGLESTALVHIRIDNNPPVLSITEPGEGRLIKEVLEITGTVTDPYLQEYALSMADSTCLEAANWSLLRKGQFQVEEARIAALEAMPVDGPYCLLLTATDELGNASELEVDFSIDTLPPASPFLSGSLEGGDGIVLTWQGNSEPDLDGFNLYRNGEKLNFELIPQPEFLDADLGEGEYTYTVRAVDKAGWESDDSNQVTLAVDFTPPEVSIHAPRNDFVVGNFVDILGRAYSEDDFKEYRLLYGRGGNPQTWQMLRSSPVPEPYGVLARWDVISLEDGPYVIRLQAEDLSGNSNEKNVTVLVDNTPPAAPVLLSAFPKGTSVDLTWQANNESDLAGYLLYRNGQPANSQGVVIGDLSAYLMTDLSYLDVAVPDGLHEYSLVAVDQAGNMSDLSNSIKASINSRPPHLIITEPSSGQKFEQEIFVKGDSEDTDIAAVQFQYQSPGTIEWTDIEAPLTTRPYFIMLDPDQLGWEYGNYRLRGVARDEGGLIDTDPHMVDVVYMNLTPPAAPMGISSRVNGGIITLAWEQNQEADLAGYNIYLEPAGTRRNSEVLTVLSYSDPANSIYGHSNGEYTFSVTALDVSGNESGRAFVKATVFTPILLSQADRVNIPLISLEGEAVPGARVEIFREALSGDVSLGTFQADEKGLFSTAIILVEGENALYAIATDAQGNVSRHSSVQRVTYDKVPAIPTGLAADVNGYDVTLSWNASLENDLRGYNLYRNDRKINLPETASSDVHYASELGDRASLAADGNPETYWNSYSHLNEFGTEWWSMHFSELIYLSSIDIEWGGTELWPVAARDYVIQAATGSGWVDIVKVAGNSVKRNIHQFEEPVGASGIRILITDSMDYYNSTYKYVHLAEVKVIRETFFNREQYDDLALPDGTYDYQVSAVDLFGSESSLSQKVTAVVGDTTPPAAPANLVANPSGSDIELSWTANTEVDLAGYSLYRTTGADWERVNPVQIDGAGYVDTALPNGTYTYRVAAVDKVGNEGPFSNESMATIEEQLPAPPRDLTAVSAPAGRAADLCWAGSVDDVAGYHVCRSEIAGGPYVVVNGSLIEERCYHDEPLIDGKQYYYVVRTLDAAGNESDNSNEASVVPRDSLAPEKPILLLPTVSGRPYQSSTGEIDVAGYGEPGALVDLIQDGQWIDTVDVRLEQVRETAHLNGEATIYETVVLPDGKTVFYSQRDTTTAPSVYDYYTFRKDLETGEETRIEQIPEGSWEHKVSPDGIRIAYTYADQAGKARVGIFDITEGTTSPLTLDEGVEEWEPSWSRDGATIVFDGDRGDGGWDIWAHDMTTGKTSRVTSNVIGFYPEVSADGRKVSFLLWDAATRSYSLYLVDRDGGTPFEVGRDIDWTGYYPSAEWSPKGSKLAFTANFDGTDDIYIYEAATGEISRLTASGEIESSLQWSPEGESIAYFVEAASGTEVRMIAVNGKAESVLLHSFAGRIDNDFLWTPAGIFYRVDSDLHRIIPPGTFIFSDVRLHSGKNMFTARAEDAAGNISKDADEIIVQVDADAMPELEVGSEDIFILRNSPFAGEEATIGAVIRNTSQVGAKNVEAELYVRDANEDIRLIHTETIANFEPHSEEWLSVNWDSTSQAGLNTIYVLLDPDNVIAEAREDNNRASRDFYVTDEGGLTWAMSLNGSQFSSDEIASITVSLGNGGPAQDVHLTVLIEDGDGAQVEELAALDRNLTYGGSDRVELTWSAGSVFAGSYQVRAILEDTLTGMVEEQVLPFTVLPDVDITARVTSDRMQYGPDENVRLALSVGNLGVNWVVDELTVELTIAEGGQVHHVEEHRLVNLFPGESTAINASWHAARNHPGQYNAAMDVFHGNVLVARSSADFTIVPGMDISGTVTVEPKLILQGGTVAADFSIVCEGNVEAGPVQLQLVVLDASDWSISASYEQNLTLGLNERIDGNHVFGELPLGIGIYQVFLQALYQDEVISLASDTFTVRDGVPPVVTVQSPVAGSVLHTSFDLSVTAVDSGSGVGAVDYRVDDGAWLPMPLVDPAAGRYASRWLPVETDEGTHTVRFRAADRAGNQSLPTARSIIIQPVVNMTVTVDRASYGMHEDATVAIELGNIAWQKHIQLGVQIENAAGDFVAQLAAEDLVLPADGQVSRSYTWNTGDVDAGQYVLRSTVIKNGAIITEHAGSFDIDKVVALNGVQVLADTEFSLGEPVRVDWSVTNNGNGNMTGLTVENVLNDETQNQLQTWSETFALNKGETISGSFLVQSGELELGSYQIVLQARYAGERFVLEGGQFTLIDSVPPVLSILSPTEGERIDGSIELSVSAGDDASGVERVEYRVDQGPWQQLQAAGPDGGTYATLWSPVEVGEGNRILFFRGWDLAGNVSEPVSVGVVVELCNPYEELGAILAVQPEPLYYSQDLVLDYSLVNQCSKPLNDITIRVAVMDQATNEIIHEMSDNADIASLSTLRNSITLSSHNLEERRYLVQLIVSQSGEAPRVVAESTFEVLPGIEVGTEPLDQRELLVWLNTGPGTCSGDEEESHENNSYRRGKENAQEDGEEKSAHREEGCKEACTASDRIENIVQQATDSATLVCSGDAFEFELRNPIYTDILIIGDHNPLTDHSYEELRELVYSGTGLISFGWNRAGDHLHDEEDRGHHDHSESVLGVDNIGSFGGHAPPIILTDSPVTAAGELNVAGRLQRVEQSADLVVAGWINGRQAEHCRDDDDDRGSRQRRNSSKDDCKAQTVHYPVITLHKYGLSHTIYSAFNLCEAFTDFNEGQLAKLLKSALVYGHGTSCSTDLVPYQTKPFVIEIFSPVMDFDLQMNTVCSSGLLLFDSTAGKWIETYPWSVSLPVQAGGKAYLPYYALALNQKGIFTCDFTAGMKGETQYTSLAGFSHAFTVARDRRELLKETLGMLESLPAIGSDRSKQRIAVKLVKKVAQRDLTGKTTTEKNIHDLTRAVNALLRVENGDIHNIRLHLDTLLRIEQGRNYLFE